MIDTSPVPSVSSVGPKPVPGRPEMLVGAVAYALSLTGVALVLPLVESQATAGILGLLASGFIGLVAALAASLV